MGQTTKGADENEKCDIQGSLAARGSSLMPADSQDRDRCLSSEPLERGHVRTQKTSGSRTQVTDIKERYVCNEQECKGRSFPRKTDWT
jgi:hypothetical protein